MNEYSTGQRFFAALLIFCLTGAVICCCLGLWLPALQWLVMALLDAGLLALTMEP